MNNLSEIFKGLIPLNEDGVAITSESSRHLSDSKQAESVFKLARTRLLDINNWYQLDEKIAAKFTLIAPNGNKDTAGIATINHYIKIDIPGPGNPSGDGFDWVKIEEVQALEEPDLTSVGIRVRPAAPPGKNTDTVAHFYDQQATSTFLVFKSGLQVKAIVFDRNTKINTEGDSLIDKARNLIVGAGAIAAFSKIQWKFFTEALLN